MQNFLLELQICRKSEILPSITISDFQHEQSHSENMDMHVRNQKLSTNTECWLLSVHERGIDSKMKWNEIELNIKSHNCE